MNEQFTAVDAAILSNKAHQEALEANVPSLVKALLSKAKAAAKEGSCFASHRVELTLPADVAEDIALGVEEKIQALGFDLTWEQEFRLLSTNKNWVATFNLSWTREEEGTVKS